MHNPEAGGNEFLFCFTFSPRTLSLPLFLFKVKFCRNIAAEKKNSRAVYSKNIDFSIHRKNTPNIRSNKLHNFSKKASPPLETPTSVFVIQGFNDASVYHKLRGRAYISRIAGADLEVRFTNSPERGEK